MITSTTTSGNVNINPAYMHASAAPQQKESSVGNLAYHKVTPENVSNYLKNMSSETTHTLASKMCTAADNNQPQYKPFAIDSLKAELKNANLPANDMGASKGLRKFAIIDNLLTVVKTASRANEDELKPRETIYNFCGFLKQANSCFETGKEKFVKSLLCHLDQCPPAYTPHDPLLPTAPALEPQPIASGRKPFADDINPSPYAEQLAVEDPQPKGGEMISAAVPDPVVTEQTVVTDSQMSQLAEMIKQFNIQDQQKPKTPLPDKPADQSHGQHKSSEDYLAQINRLSPDTIAEARGNWGNRIDLENGLSMTCQTHANFLDKNKPNHLRIRQTAYHGGSINKGDLDNSESSRVRMTFKKQQILTASWEQNDKHFALELGAPGATTYIPKCQLKDGPPTLAGYQPSGQNYVFFTVKLPTGKIISEGWILPGIDSVAISSDSGKDIKGYDLTTRLQEVEEAFNNATGKSFYDRPENILSIKITPYWGYKEETPILWSAGVDYPDGKNDLETDSTHEDVTHGDLIARGTHGMTRGATVASEKTFGGARSTKARSDYVLPGKSVYIDIASYQVK